MTVAIVKELEAQVSLGSHEAQLQLGLCHITGFGAGENVELGLDMITLAAEGGLLKAKAVIARLHLALAIPLPEEKSTLIRQWLKDGVESGSWIALADFSMLYPSAHKIRDPYRLAIGRLEGSSVANSREDQVCSGFDPYRSQNSSDSERSLVMAVRSGDIDFVQHSILSGAAVGYRGPCGETPLHWSTLLPGVTGVKIAQLLLGAGADINQETSSECIFSDYDHLANSVATYTTPMEWAVSLDNLVWVQSFFAQQSYQSRSTNQHLVKLLASAAFHNSVEVLEYLCENVESSTIQAFNDKGLSTLYYAIRPNFLDHLFRLVSVLVLA